MVKERSLWERISLQPWSSQGDAKKWYHTNLESPTNALIAADKSGAYLLTDRSTLLRQTARRTITNTTVFFEPTMKDDVLLNSCWASQAAHPPSKEVETDVRRFLDWLMGEVVQALVRSFGQEEAGLPFFARVRDGYCRELLRGGRPKGGEWMSENATETV